MKKLLAIILSALMVLSFAAGCTKDNGSGDTNTAAPANNDNTTTPANNDNASVGTGDKEVTVWSFTNELRVGALAFVEKNPDVKVNYEYASDQDGVFESKVDAAITSGNVPDVVALEAAFVRKYVELPNVLMSIEDLRPAIADSKNYEFMVQVGVDFEGTLKALSWQATPGGLVYKRSLATKYLGTDDPKDIAAMTKDMKAYEETAAKLKDASGNTCFVTGCVDEFANAYYSMRKQPWIDLANNKLVIDPLMTEMLEVSKRFKDEGYIGTLGMWNDNWSNAINGTLADADGTPRDVFSFFLPTWGLTYVIPNWAGATQTIGDWGLVPGPLAYSWGGTWAGVMNVAKNPDTAKELVKFIATDIEHLKKWALGEYTNEYLKNIDPSLPDDVSQGAGDFLVSRVANEQVAPTAPTDLLGGQNSYEVWAPIAENTNQDMLQGTNGLIQRYFNDAIAGYMTGELSTIQEALDTFTDSVKTEMPDLNW